MALEFRRQGTKLKCSGDEWWVEKWECYVYRYGNRLLLMIALWAIYICMWSFRIHNSYFLIPKCDWIFKRHPNPNQDKLFPTAPKSTLYIGFYYWLKSILLLNKWSYDLIKCLLMHSLSTILLNINGVPFFRYWKLKTAPKIWIQSSKHKKHRSSGDH